MRTGGGAMRACSPCTTARSRLVASVTAPAEGTARRAPSWLSTPHANDVSCPILAPRALERASCGGRRSRLRIRPMAKVNQGRWTAEIDGDFVVFLIGARLQFRHPIRSLRDLGGRRGMK